MARNPPDASIHCEFTFNEAAPVILPKLKSLGRREDTVYAGWRCVISVVCESSPCFSIVYHRFGLSATSAPAGLVGRRQEYRDDGSRSRYTNIGCVVTYLIMYQTRRPEGEDLVERTRETVEAVYHSRVAALA